MQKMICNLTLHTEYKPDSIPSVESAPASNPEKKRGTIVTVIIARFCDLYMLALNSHVKIEKMYHNCS